MATTGRPAAERPDVDALAATLGEADFVHLVSHADGDAIAAAGLLATALGTDTPYQVSTARTRAAADRRLGTTDDATVALGFDATDADVSLVADSVALAAYDVATTIGDGDPVLALAGALAAGVVPQGPVLDAAAEAGVERRSGVGLPTADLADGLAHSRLFHAGFSGQEGQAGAFLADLDLPADLDEAAHERVASAVALDATEPPAPPRAADAIEAALRPHVLPDGPFETAEGYGDVLDALARTAPGLATTLAVGRFDRAGVLDAWRDHAAAVHAAVRMAERSRHQGLVVLETEGADTWTVARLARDFRSAEPAVLVVGDDVALATTDRNAREILADAGDPDAMGGRDRLASAGPAADVDAIVRSLTEDP
ncbi:MAG: hypothetical protein ABEJ67_04465 [Halanaeroarchaeum sp.]